MTTLTNTRTVRIEWGDCDPAGIIFYPTYFKIFDNATAALFEAALGMTKFQYLKAYDFAGFPLARVRCFGFSEDMPEGLARMRRVVGLELGAPVLANANPARESGEYDIPEPKTLEDLRAEEDE